MRNQIIGQNYDEERALYHLMDTDVIDCTFAGPADGESVLKEARSVDLQNCQFSLRYPLWHVKEFRLTHCDMDEKTRAPIWYSENGGLFHCSIRGIKCLRECKNILIQGGKIVSPEFGWKCDSVVINDTELESEYLFFETKNLEIARLQMTGKYSFQYTENVVITDSVLDTKDAFWHSKNVTVKNSFVKGEYLGWFSEGLTLVDCQIEGTQPLCYCKDLTLVNCTMKDTDLSFEYSDVHADIQGHVLSIKNPRSGVITVDSVGEIIKEDPVMPCTGEVVIRNQNPAE